MKELIFADDIESAAYYDTLPRFSKEVYDYLEEIGVSNKTIADVGSGTGRIAIDLLERKNIVYAIDPDSNMRAICEKKCEKFKDKFISIDGDDINMNIPDKSVDYVIVSQSYHRFTPSLFKKECNRVLKDTNNVLLIWYRVDFENSIYKEMLASIKENYPKYETRYELDEVEGAKAEEIENTESALEFFESKCKTTDIISKSKLNLQEFLNLGLSLALYPLIHFNSISEVLSLINVKKYTSDLKNIFEKYKKDSFIELELRVQIYQFDNK